MSPYDDGSPRGRSDHYRDHSPDYTYAGGAGEPYRAASPGHTTYAGHTSQPRLLEPQGPSYSPPPQHPTDLQLPDSRLRPRSLPPPLEYRHPRSPRAETRERRRRRHDDSDYSDDSDGARSPKDKARNFVDRNFSNSTSGLGIGVLGALVGGLAAREASEATGRLNGRHHRHRDDPDHKRNQIISTVVGAAVGGLGANAFEKRLEERDRLKQEKWERKWRPDADVLEKREVIRRPRSGGSIRGGSRRDWGPWDERDGHRSRSRGHEREVDTGARSWKDVEDWVYDDRKSGVEDRRSWDS